MKINQILDYFDKIIPNPKGELNYNKDYELLIAVMLSAQCTDRRVNNVTEVLFTKYDTLEELNKADIENIKNIIRSVGNFNKKAIYILGIAGKVLKGNNGIIPNNRDFLESLPGVGRKTANVVLSILFNEPVLAVDTHIIRVSKRLAIARKEDSVITIEKKLTKLLPKDNIIRYHHQFLLFGRYYCKAVKPLCENCELKNICIEKSHLN